MDYEKTLEQLENYFCDLLIMQYRQAPKNRKMVKLLVDTVFANCLTQQIADKTINLQESVGAQLDTVGKWLMVDRNYKANPVFTKQYFAMPSNSQIKNNATLDIQGGMVNYSDFVTTTGAVLNYEEEISVYSQNASLNDTLFKQLCELAAMRNSIQYSMKNIDEAIYEWSNGEVYTTWNKVFNKEGFTVVGSPTITEDGIASGFSDSNYLRTNVTSLIGIGSNSIWSFKISFDLPESTSNRGEEIIHFPQGNFCHIYVSYPSKVIHIQPLFASVAESVIEINGTEFKLGSHYDLKIRYTGNDMVVNCTIDNEYTKTYAHSLPTTPVTFSYPTIHIGYCPSSVTKEYIFPFTGTIDLSQFLITVDGVEVFSGLKTQPLTLTYHYPTSYSQLITLAYNKGILPRPTGVQILLEEIQ